jgi:hypothetical protein
MAQGHRFAREWSTFFNCRVAGHTYVIWLAQSGLHELRPGEAPDWPEDEGVPKSGDGPPKKALWSTPFTRNTVSCFASRVPSRR